MGGGATADAAVIPAPKPTIAADKGKKAASDVEADPDAASGEADGSATGTPPAKVSAPPKPASVPEYVTSIQNISGVVLPDGFNVKLDGATVKLTFQSDDKKNEFKKILSDSLKAKNLVAPIQTMLNALPSGGFLEIDGVRIAKTINGAAAVQMLKRSFSSPA